jgi:plasmid stabilization system protein ParE
MSLEVRWTEEAEYTFDCIFSFIVLRWGDKAALKFKDKTKRTILNISQQPLIFPECGVDNVRKGVITKQSSVFYEVTTHISLVYFWDNRQDPLFT